MKIGKIICAFICTAVMMLSSVTVAHADFGGYGDGGGGGGGNDYYYGGDNYDSDSSAGGRKANKSDFVAAIIIISFMGAIGVLCFIDDKVKKKKYYRDNPSAISSKESMLIHIPFDYVMLEEYVRTLFVDMQNSWQNKDISSIREYLTPELYNRNVEYLKMNIIDPGYTNYIENINIRQINFYGVIKVGESYVLSVNIEADMTDYTVEDSTGRLVKGKRNKSVKRFYTWLLICNDESTCVYDWKLASIK